MLAADMSYLTQAGYSAIFPGIAIALTVGSLGIIADGLRDATRSGTQRVAEAPGAVSDDFDVVADNMARVA
jgi:hypothetical protein